MEKAKLIIRETKKRKLVSELHFEEGNKIMPFSQFGPKDTSLNGTIVGVEREKGQIVKVQVGEKILYPTVPGHSPGYKAQKRMIFTMIKMNLSLPQLLIISCH